MIQLLVNTVDQQEQALNSKKDTPEEGIFTLSNQTDTEHPQEENDQDLQDIHLTKGIFNNI